jgi:hypothetical protein
MVRPNDPTPVSISKFINQRRGGNEFVIKRSGGLRTDPVPRDMLELPAARLARLDKPKPIPVELSSKTLSELLDVRIPDPTDTIWLEEKQRLKEIMIASGDSPQEVERNLRGILPFGRKQRSNLTRDNVATSNLKMSKKIDEIREEVAEYRSIDAVERGALLRQLEETFEDTQALMALNKSQQEELVKLVNRLGVPKTWQESGLPRLIDSFYYRENSGRINAYIYASIGEISGLDVDTPVFGVGGDPIKFLTFAQQMNSIQSGRYFDLQNNRLLNFNSMVALVDDIPETSGIVEVNMEAAAENSGQLSVVGTPVPLTQQVGTPAFTAPVTPFTAPLTASVNIPSFSSPTPGNVTQSLFETNPIVVPVAAEDEMTVVPTLEELQRIISNNKQLIKTDTTALKKLPPTAQDKKQLIEQRIKNRKDESRQAQDAIDLYYSE